MRKLSVVLGVLLVPALAMAQNVSLDALSGNWADVEGGSGSSSYDSGGVTIPAGTQWVVWTLIHTDVPLDGFQWALHANGGADDGSFQIAGYAHGPLYDQYLNAVVDGYGSTFFVPDFITPSDPTRWGYTEYSKLAVPKPLGTTELMFSNDAPKTGLDNKTFVGYIVENTVDLTSGSYAIDINGPVQGAENGFWTSSGNSPSSGPLSGSSFVISVPEPASALLLLAAVPFLRRRRA